MFFLKIFFSIATFFKEVRGEIKKVSWLTRREVIQYTALVFLVSLILAAYLGTVDYVLGQALRIVIAR